jgi:hypothetical protein
VRGGGKIRMWAIFTTYRILGKSFTKFVCIFHNTVCLSLGRAGEDGAQEVS